MNVINEFQINAQGMSNGLPIPTGFRILVIQANVIAVNPTIVSHRLELQTETYQDINYTTPLSNDDLEALSNFNDSVAYYNSPSLSSGIKTVSKNAIFADLETVYGTGNVVVIT